MIKISSGPLQGFTDDVFRYVHKEIYGGVDAYFGPYIRLENHKPPKPSQIRDIESPLNQSIPFIPQILSKDAPLMIQQIKHLKNLGFHEINWNLGCPYPMVAKRGLGSGLLNQANLVKEILSNIFSELQVQLSVKCRLGLESDLEIYKLVEVFNEFDLSEIIIHARTAKQMYKGEAQPKKIIPVIKESKNQIAYNGDISSVDVFNAINYIFEGKIQHFMIGRGLIANPGLANEIRGIDNQAGSFKEFHQSLTEKYLERYQDHQLLRKMQGFWEYFASQFPDNKKELKKIKKARKWEAYLQMTNQLFKRV